MRGAGLLYSLPLLRVDGTMIINSVHAVVGALQKAGRMVTPPVPAETVVAGTSEGLSLWTDNVRFPAPGPHGG